MAVETFATEVPPPPELPARHEHLTGGEWVRRNLFDSWYNALITVVLAAGVTWAAYRGLRWTFVTADWEIVRVNLTLAMLGRFPRNELWRAWGELYLAGAGVGLATGLVNRSATELAEAAGTDPPVRQAPFGLARRFWPLLLLLVVLLAFTRTWQPTVLAVIGLAIVFGAAAVGRSIPRRNHRWAWLADAALFLGAIQVVTGLAGVAWFPIACLVAVAGWTATAQVSLGRWGGIVRLVAALVVAGAAGRVVSFLGDIERAGAEGAGQFPFRGVGWDVWGGLQVTVFVTIVGVVLAFPVGLVAALGRRSDLPMMRIVSTGYIELIRGVPLITILLVGVQALEFFFPVGFTVPSQITLATIAVLLFSGAYLAEIVRGGLQSVPKGQIEAAQAIGLSAGKVQRLIVLPQALRAVIPSMVGQFISLFKDTSLLAIISIFELLRWSEVANAQPDFVGRGGFAQTLPFAMFIYWAISFTMSRESQRLERRLGVARL